MRKEAARTASSRPSGSWKAIFRSETRSRSSMRSTCLARGGQAIEGSGGSISAELSTPRPERLLSDAASTSRPFSRIALAARQAM